MPVNGVHEADKGPGVRSHTPVLGAPCLTVVLSRAASLVGGVAEEDQACRGPPLCLPAAFRPLLASAFYRARAVQEAVAAPGEVGRSRAGTQRAIYN